MSDPAIPESPDTTRVEKTPDEIKQDQYGAASSFFGAAASVGPSRNPMGNGFQMPKGVTSSRTASRETGIKEPVEQHPAHKTFTSDILEPPEGWTPPSLKAALRPTDNPNMLLAQSFTLEVAPGEYFAWDATQATIVALELLKRPNAAQFVIGLPLAHAGVAMAESFKNVNKEYAMALPDVRLRQAVIMAQYDHRGGRFQAVIDGTHRMYAALHRGWKSVAAIVLPIGISNAIRMSDDLAGQIRRNDP